MLRRDYILRMIEEFAKVLSRIQSLKAAQSWREAGLTLDEELKRLIGADTRNSVALSETEMLARLIQGGHAQSVPDKTLMLATLLKEAGDLAQAEDKPEQARTLHLKGLHLLLNALGRGEISEMPAYVPAVEAFLIALNESLLPTQTQAMLMQYFERIGEFSRAEDALFTILEQADPRSGVIELGISFYERLKNQSDSNLQAGNLPRTEVEAGLAELRSRLTTVN